MSKKNRHQPVQTTHPPESAWLKQHEHVEIVRRSGPLPSPAEMERYNRLIPNGAERILKMAEAQSAHRIQIEKTVIDGQQSQASRGQALGFIAVLVALGCATYSAVIGAQAYACTVASTVILGLSGAFIGGKYIQRKDLAEKARNRPEPPAA